MAATETGRPILNALWAINVAIFATDRECSRTLSSIEYLSHNRKHSSSVGAGGQLSGFARWQRLGISENGWPVFAHVFINCTALMVQADLADAVERSRTGT